MLQLINKQLLCTARVSDSTCPSTANPDPACSSCCCPAPLLCSLVCGPVRVNMVVSLADLASRFPNVMEPWTAYLYEPLAGEGH